MNQIDYQQDLLERFIPANLEELIDTLSLRVELSPDDKYNFLIFCQHYRNLYHAQTLPDYQSLTRYYAPFNPDRDSINDFSYSETEKYNLQKKLLDELKNLLNDANYESLTQEQLNITLGEISPYGVKVSVNFDEFAEILLFYRGSAIHTKEQRDWKRLYLKTKTIQTKVYRRLFILLKFKSTSQLAKELADSKKISLAKAEEKIKRQRDKTVVDEDKIYIKLFKNIPRADLEMLFPNTKIKMRLFDKLKLAVTGGGGTIGGVMTIVTKLAIAIEPLAMATALFGFAGLLWRQITKIFVQRAKYMAELAKNLYYYNLDNNLGAISHLKDVAAISEAKETILSYFFLFTQGQMSVSDLDKKVEQFIKDEYGVSIDFEVEDGLKKLEKLGVLIKNNEQVNVLPLSETELILKQHWEKCF